MTHLTELAERLSSRRLGEGDWDNVSLVAEWLNTSLNRCGLSLTTSPDTREVLEWQPIESAPHDWSWFLGWGPDVDHAILRLPANPIWAELPDCTHWMPLPEPPRTILVRSKLPMDRERLIEALTPSGDTKAAYHGEFKFDVPLDGYDEDGEPLEGVKSVYVPWTTVKEIMAAIRERASLTAMGSQSIEGERRTIRETLAAIEAKRAAMPPDERAKLEADELAAQRESWIRSMEPCEHGNPDFEQCEQCQPLAKDEERHA